MICLRCGYCCKYLCVVILSDPNKGILNSNMELHEGNGESCKYLQGDKPGEYTCSVHDSPWYEDTPCFKHTQIERHPDTNCRMGVHQIKKFEEGQSEN